MIKGLLGACERILVFNWASPLLAHFLAKRFCARNLITQMYLSQTVGLSINQKVMFSLSGERFKRMTYFARMVKSRLANNLLTVFTVSCGSLGYVLLWLTQLF